MSLYQSQRDLQLTHSFNSIVLDFCDALWRNRAFSNDSRPYPTLLFHLSRFVVHALNKLSDCLSAYQNILTQCTCTCVCSTFNPNYMCVRKCMAHLCREFLASCQLHSVHDKLSIIHHPALVAYVHKFFNEVHVLIY